MPLTRTVEEYTSHFNQLLNFRTILSEQGFSQLPQLFHPDFISIWKTGNSAV